ncbi:MAG TPA: glycerol-3-phosphate dehydrogenase/oxidase [Planctomycetota bacterium]|nr:glycerol-3-phosphate dehydrogenase/oxidase [Planctomycetota bacterium]
MNRDLALQKLKTGHFDLLIIGGGITGCGIALDAASRGLRVGLIERGDFSSGTSSKSSKLIHGGLRYLRQLQFKVTLEASREKARLKKMAPHLVVDLPFLLPLWTRAARPMISSGLWIYDAAAGFPKGLIHKHLSRAETQATLPGLLGDGLRGGFLYYDARADDCRLVLHIARKAVELGAVLANRLPATGFLKSRGRVAGVRTPLFEIQATRVINASGVWCDEVRAVDDPAARATIRPSKGVHLIVPARRLALKTAAMLPSPDRRIVFLIPEGDRAIIGTTDTDYSGSLDRARAEAADIEYLLGVVNANLPKARLTRADVQSTYAGLRPLLVDGADVPSKASREHHLFESASGLITLTGGKLTTWRLMAKQVLDRLTRIRCRTHLIDLYSTAARDPLSHLYGSTAAEIGDRRPLIDGLPYVWGEVEHAVGKEMAGSLTDVLSRRMRVALYAEDRGAGVAPAVAERMAPLLGWGKADIRDQVDAYLAELEGNYPR